MNEKNQGVVNCKIILVGDSGVGKTTIIGRYLNKLDKQEQSTLGASFANKTENIDGNIIKFEIWDTAGQERFRSVNSIFYQKSYICIMVFDITKQESFDHLDNFWYEAVKQYAHEKVIFHVCGNKIDLFDKEEVDRAKVIAYCEKINCNYNFVSAYEDNNFIIDEMFKNLGKKFINSDIYKEITKTKDTSNVSLKEDKKGKKKKIKFC
jgi:small GTP-binding protein